MMKIEKVDKIEDVKKYKDLKQRQVFIMPKLSSHGPYFKTQVGYTRLETGDVFNDSGEDPEREVKVVDAKLIWAYKGGE